MPSQDQFKTVKGVAAYQNCKNLQKLLTRILNSAICNYSKGARGTLLPLQKALPSLRLICARSMAKAPIKQQLVACYFTHAQNNGRYILAFGIHRSIGNH